MAKFSLRLGRLAVTAAFAAAIAAMPIGIDWSALGFDDHAAFARSGGGGGGGNGGGNGHGGMGGHAAAGAGEGFGQGKNAEMSGGLRSRTDISASALGRLNATHALVNGTPNAAHNSAVGRIAAFRDALAANDLEAAAAELAAVANKTVTPEIVGQVAMMAGVAMDEETASAVAEMANSIAAEDESDDDFD